MKIDGLFPTPLISSVLQDSGRLCGDLRQIILAKAESDSGTQRSNNGGWQSTPDFADWSGEAGSSLIASVRGVVDHFTGVSRGGEVTRPRLNWNINAWANINRSGASNNLHHHPGAYWSSVFYVDDGGINGSEALGGALEFTDPRGPLPLMYAPSLQMTISNCTTAGYSERVFPQTGLLVIFPAWLGHRVTAYTGAGARISIAMNFAL